MGFIARRLVPRSVRRAVHPVRTAKRAAYRAVVPRGVRRTVSTAHKVANPLSTAGYAVEKSVFGPRSRRRQRPAFGAGRGRRPGRTRAKVSAASGRSSGRSVVAALLAVVAFISFFSGAVVPGLFLLMGAAALWSIAAGARGGEKPPAA